MADEPDLTSRQALAEMRIELGNANPAFLAQCEKNADEMIANMKQHGDSGRVFLGFLAIRLAAAVEGDEI